MRLPIRMPRKGQAGWVGERDSWRFVEDITHEITGPDTQEARLDGRDSWIIVEEITQQITGLDTHHS